MGCSRPMRVAAMSVLSSKSDAIREELETELGD